MTKFLVSLSAATLIACAGAAVAADLPMKASPMAAPAPTWTGLYINAGLGYGMWSADTTVVSAAGVPTLPGNQTQGGRGWDARVGLGYDYQFAPTWVAGVFGDYDFGRIKGTIQDQGPFAIADATQNWSWAAGARLGYLITPQILTYVNGGYSSAHFTTGTVTNSITGAPLAFSYNSITANGWFFGGGTETTFFKPGWFWRNEYRLASYGSQTFNQSPVGASNITFKPYVQTITTALVWKFTSR